MSRAGGSGALLEALIDSSERASVWGSRLACRMPAAPHVYTASNAGGETSKCDCATAAARRLRQAHRYAAYRQRTANVTVDVFRALADPIRLELLALIAANGPMCVCHLEEALRYKQPRISKHLGTLRRAGLVHSRREGTWVYYELNDEMLEVATSFIDQVQTSA
jgi:ArsR family transcriptional regulator